MTRTFNLADFTPIPGFPGYLAHPDGRIVSLKKRRPTILVEHARCHPNLNVVKMRGAEVHVRDLLMVMFGDASGWEPHRCGHDHRPSFGEEMER